MQTSPHTPLYSAKARIISRLKEYLANSNANSDDYSTFEIALEKIDLWSLLPYLDIPQKVFFRDREANTEYLGAKFLKIFTGAFALEKAQKHIDENPLLVVLGGQRFHPNMRPSTEWEELGSHYYVLPQFLFVNKNDHISLRINVCPQAFKRSSQAMRLLLDVENLFSFKGHAQNNLSFDQISEVPNFEQWDKQVSKAHNAFKQGLLNKVVLSRKHVLSTKASLKPDNILEQLKTRSGEHFIFHIQWRTDRAFTSLTPERLFKLKDKRLISDAIAGTRPRGHDDSSDLSYADELKNSEKELEEHRYVSESVLNTMKSIGCLNAGYDGAIESIMKLSHVQHLHTRVSADLGKPQTLSQLVDAFHPTPAVGGTPKVDASEWLEENESYDRGFYAAPLGVIDADGADFCVGIRSCLTNGNELHIFAGAGIVTASQSQSEWNETATKMKNYSFKIKQPVTIGEHGHEQHPIM